MIEHRLNYKQAGVDYVLIDAMKRYAQQRAATVPSDLHQYGFLEIEISRGQSAFVLDVGPCYDAITVEGLGTKNLIADAIGHPARTYYDAIAQDTIAMIVNDLITVGAQPLTISPLWVMGSSDWFTNEQRWKDLVDGWACACEAVGAAYVAGETAVLTEMVHPGRCILSGSGRGIISPKERLTLGDRLVPGDHIILVESNGIHANGLSLARKIAAERLPQGYATPLPGGLTFGEALLKPTHLYSRLQNDLFSAGIDIHYMINITGHGWRKLMRADQEMTYRMHTLPPVLEEFLLMQRAGAMTDEAMYATFNMGAGFAFIVPAADAAAVQDIAASAGYQSWDAGLVETGDKQVVIEPLGITYSKETLELK